MRIKFAAVAAGLIAALGAIALLPGSAAAHTRRRHSAPAHHRRHHRRTVQPVRPPATMPRHEGGAIQDPVWGHQGRLRTLRPRSSARSQATAASCTLAQCGADLDDPIQSGCWDANAYIANTAPFPVQGTQLGYVANWYSPDCGTNWAETVVTKDPGAGGEYFYAQIEDMVTFEYYYYDSASNGTYTDMTHSATDTACANGGIGFGLGHPAIGTAFPGACA